MCGSLCLLCSSIDPIFLTLIAWLTCFLNRPQGQTESKKHGSRAGRRHNGNAGGPLELGEQPPVPHTKGTAMSFGFRKKLNGTPKKFKKLLEGSTGSGGGGETPQTDTKDDNGNAGE